MRKRGPHRFFLGLLTISLVAIHLAPGARADAPPSVGIGTGTSTDVNLPVPPDAGSPRVDPPAPVGTGTSTDTTIVPTVAPADPIQPTKEVSPIALCDPDDGSEQPRPGYGAPVLRFPNKSKQGRISEEYINAEKRFIADRRQAIIDSPAINHVHLAFKDEVPGRPSLAASVKAREAFFELSFGTLEPSFAPGAIETVCQAKKDSGELIKQYSDLNQLSKNNIDSCEGAFKDAKKTLLQAQTVTEKYAKGVNDLLKGKINLEQHYFDFRKINHIELMKVGPKGKPANQIASSDYPQLKREYEALWGKDNIPQPEISRQIEESGVYSRILLQTRRELQDAKKKIAELKSYAADMDARQKKCDSLTNVIGTGTGTGTSTSSTITGPIKPPDVVGTGTNTGVGTSTNTETKPEDPIGPPPPPPVGVGTNTSVGVSTGTNTSWGVAGPIAGPPPGGPGAGEPPPQPYDPGPGQVGPGPHGGGSAIGGFLKDNWMWLAGGAVLVGGGVYLYKKHQKNERYEAYWQNDTNFLPPQSNSSSSSGASSNSSSGGQIPPGAKLILTTAVSGVSVGQTFSVSLALVDANGVVQSGVSNLQVEASCLTPNPCSLDGAKSVTLMGGKVTFNSLKFNQPDQGVTLQFSAPGVANVTTPGTFNVGGSAPRQ